MTRVDDMNRQQRRGLKRRLYGEASFSLDGDQITLRMDYYVIKAIETHFDTGVEQAFALMEDKGKISDQVTLLQMMCLNEVSEQEIFDALFAEDKGLLDAIDTVMGQCFPEAKEEAPPKKTKPRPKKKG